jgi:PiT family inorganic phosphate transporter
VVTTAIAAVTPPPAGVSEELTATVAAPAAIADTKTPSAATTV